MKLRNFGRRRWIMIGLVVGSLVGVCNWASSPGYRDDNSRTLSQPLFERGLTAPPGAAFRLSDLTIHPPDAGGVYWITGTYYESAGRDEVHSGRFKFRAATPYEPRLAVDVADLDTFTVVQYLDELAPRIPQAHISYRYPWYEKPGAVLTAWVAGAMLLIGFVWPTLLRKLVSPLPASDVAALATSSGPPAPGMPVSPPAADDDLLELVANLEANATTTAGSPAPVEIPADLSAPVRVLSATPLDAPVAKLPQEEKDYRGEYYPTIVHANHSSPVSRRS
ncbi:MAG TPA: hypothetical protein VG269_19215 [Tepidisphaeraceae bacterium]|jgi:hypothetical protein|nr:hypothetical protein [Tepidisphaeraceae bacterium]